jgi:photosystem II stability/assembly factor-like uncharacterized protein
MKIRYILLLFFPLICTSDIFSQTSWDWKNPSPQGNALRSVVVKADTFGIAVGDAGTTLRRSKGVFLSPVYPVSSALGGVCFYKDTIWVAGDGGKIYRSVDNGVTLTSQSYSTAVNFHTCFDLSKTNLWVAGDSGIILYTTNSGVAWTKQANTNKRPVNAIANGYPRANVYAACDSGIILQALNYGGGGYFPIVNNHKFNFHGVAMDTVEAFVVGDSGYILHRDVVNNVDLIDTIFDKGANAFYDVAYANPYVLVVGANGAIKVSADNGQTWSSPSVGATEKLLKIGLANDFLTSGIAWVVGESGVFLRTANFGSTWSRLDSGVRGIVYAAAASPNGDMYATSLVGKSYRLQNGKTKWTLDSLKAGGAPRLTDIAFDKNGFGLIATYDINVLKTIDSGRTWVNVLVNPAAVQILGVATWASTGLASSSNGNVYRSSNKGATWTATTTGITQALYDVDISGTSAIAVGFNGAILYSFDGGLTWKKPAASVTTSLLTRVRFLSATNAIAVSANGIIIRTVDKGATWAVIPSGITTPLNAVAFHDDMNGIITGDAGIIMKTHDGGKTWTKDQSNTLYDLKGAIISDGVTAYAIGNKTTVLGTSNSALPVDLISFSGRRLSASSVLLDWSVANEHENFGYAVERNYGDNWQQVGFQSGAGNSSQSINYSLTDSKASNELLHYRLRQIDLDGAEHLLGTVAISPSELISNNDISIYPNPANSESKISFAIVAEGNVRIAIMNDLGNELSIITDAHYSAGSYSLPFSTKLLPSGSYHIVFTTASKKIAKDFVVAR